MRRYLIAAFTLALVFAPNAQSATTWYRVELIVFSLLNPNIGAETWSSSPERPSLANSVELSSGLYLNDGAGGNALHAYRRLGADHYTLQSEWTRLRRSSDFHPILHTAWQQPGLEKKESRRVHLSTGSQSEDGATVNGSIRVWRTRYLHVDADLLYRLGFDSNDSAEFRMKQHRRMRSRELHFFDHPMFGVLIYISPIAAKAKQPVSSVAAPLTSSPAPTPSVTGTTRPQ
jgi:hypothetical protein